MKHWSSGLKLDNVLQLNAVKRYKDIAETDNRKASTCSNSSIPYHIVLQFKSQVTCNLNSDTMGTNIKKTMSAPKNQKPLSSCICTYGVILIYGKMISCVLLASKSQWKSQPQRKRLRSGNDDEDGDFENDTPMQTGKDSNLQFVTARDQYVSIPCVMGNMIIIHKC